MNNQVFEFEELELQKEYFLALPPNSKKCTLLRFNMISNTPPPPPQDYR
jgi:hypothetical protein